MATYLRSNPTSFIPITLHPTQFCTSIRTDNPYPTTQFGSITNSAAVVNFQIGKTPLTGGNFPKLQRSRMGASFALPVGGWPGATSYVLRIAGGNWFSTLEPWLPQVYASATSDIGLYSFTTKPLWTWEANLNTSLGFMTTGLVIDQFINIDVSVLAPLYGQYLSIIIGDNLEFTGGGAVSSTTGDRSTMQLQGGLVSTVRCDLLVS